MNKSDKAWERIHAEIGAQTALRRLRAQYTKALIADGRWPSAETTKIGSTIADLRRWMRSRGIAEKGANE